MEGIFDDLEKKLQQTMKKASKITEKPIEDNREEANKDLEKDSERVGGDAEIKIPEPIQSQVGEPDKVNDMSAAKEYAAGKKMSDDVVIIPATDKEEMKKAFLEIRSALSEVREKSASLESFEKNSENSVIFKTAAALSGALNMIEEMELKEKKAGVAIDIMESGIIEVESYSESFKEVEKIASKLGDDMSAVEVYFNKVKMANELASSSGESEIDFKANDSAFEKMREFMES